MQNRPDYGPFEPEPAQSPPTKRRRGPAPKPLESKRKHRVAVYLNDAEFKVINGFSELSGICPAAYLRKATLNTPPIVVPSINQMAWEQLGRAAANLNQLSKSINSCDLSYLSEVRMALIRFRAALVEPQK